MYQLDKLEKKLLGSQVEEELMNYILKSPVKIGEKIPNEFELAEKFGVGRSTIREAVKGLVSKGVLEVRRGSGTYVISTISVEDDPLGLSKLEDKYKLALELFEVRLILEPEIARMAAKYATKEDKERLKALCDEAEALLTHGEDYIRKDVEFHTYIARCSKNRVVETLIPMIDTAVLTFASLTRRALSKETLETHRAVTSAILSGDEMGAKCAMVMHLTYNRQELVRLQERNKE